MSEAGQNDSKSFDTGRKEAGPDNDPDAFDSSDFPDEESGTAGLEGFGDLDLDAKPKKKGKGKGKGGKVLLLLFVLLLLLGGGGFALVHFNVVSLGGIPFLGNLTNATGTADGPDAADGIKSPEDEVRLILLENVRQYYVNNEKAGQLFVIEGKAVNNFDTAKEFIKIQATLFNAAGVSLASKEVLCGNVLSYFQLQILCPHRVGSQPVQRDGRAQQQPPIWPRAAVRRS